MAAPKGNQNAKGKKTGRKSAYQELADATDAFRMFFDEQDQELLEEKISSGKFSVADRFTLTAMEGDSKVLVAAHKKALPDSLQLSGKDGGAFVVEIVQYGKTKNTV